MNQFQLFPPPSPEGKSTNPFRKRKKKLSQPPSPIALEDMKNPNKTEAVLFQIIEDTNSIQPPPKAHITKSRSPVHRSGPSPKPKEAPRSSSRQTDGPARQASSSSAATGSTTLVNDSNRSFSSPTPQNSSPSSRSQDAPMRSMFPRYDFNLPLNQQQYYPRTSSTRTRPKPRNLTVSPAPEIDQTLGPKTVPASVMEFPADALDPIETRYSSPSELKELWEAANGQRPHDLRRTFNLRMERTDAATFTFGDAQHPFYTLNTYSTNEVSINRTDPSKPANSVHIMMLNMEDRQRREPPHDGLVTHIFSHLAAMLAIEQASQLKKRHLLTASEATEVETNALQRAAAQESYKLSWNLSRRIYELQHASIFHPQRRQPLVGTAGIALSPVQKRHPGILHISVSGSDNASLPPTIIVTAPVPSNSVEDASRAASPRTSTLPLTGSDEPLASLDLASMTLSISAAVIASTIPSFYAIDSIVAALLAVAVSDESSNPVLADLPLYRKCHPQYHPTSFKGKLITTFAERQDALEADALVSSLTSTSTSTSGKESKRAARKSFPFFSRSRSKSKSPPSSNSNSGPNPSTSSRSRKTEKITIEEFDLEKYGRYSPSSSREGQKLPSPVRGLLRTVFWVLGLLVRGLVAFVKVFAWLLVNATRCVTSDRF